MRKICVVTGTRAEYGLLHGLIGAIHMDSDLQLQLIVTGMHLSPEFGLTFKQIGNEFHIDKKIEMLMSSDTPVGITKSMGIAQISFAEAFYELMPDLLVVLGDRFEILSAVSAALIARIPVAHIHGGELTKGAVDESIRHSITKMSHMHFAATEEYRKRIIQLGEMPDRVYNVGALGIDNIKKMCLLTKEEFEESISFQLGEKNILVTFHPVTLDRLSAEDQFSTLINVLAEYKDIRIIFTKANSDTDGRIINKMVDDFVSSHSERSVAFLSLGQLRYLSGLQFVDAVVGNSSSGLLEAPSFRIGTINIGDRQEGRIMAESVICCESDTASISQAFKQLYSTAFQEKLRNVSNPYGESGACEKIINILKSISLSDLVKKDFYDIPFDIC